MFDVTDLSSDFGEHEAATSTSKCGYLEVAFAYDAPMRKMTVHVLQARDIPSKDRGGATHTQVIDSFDNTLFSALSAIKLDSSGNTLYTSADTSKPI